MNGKVFFEDRTHGIKISSLTGLVFFPALDGTTGGKGSASLSFMLVIGEVSYFARNKNHLSAILEEKIPEFFAGFSSLEAIQNSVKNALVNHHGG